LAMHKLY